MEYILQLLLALAQLAVLLVEHVERKQRDVVDKKNSSSDEITISIKKS